MYPTFLKRFLSNLHFERYFIEYLCLNSIPKTFKLIEAYNWSAWEQRKYEDLVILSQGLQIPISERYLESGLDRMLYITNEIFNNRISDRYYIKKPKESVVAKKEDILMTRTGNTGKVVTNIEGAFHNNFFKIDYKDYFNQYFLKYNLTRPETQSEILSRAGSSTIPDISHKDFYSMSVSLPNISEQTKIGELFKNIDKTITLHQRANSGKEKRTRK